MNVIVHGACGFMGREVIKYLATRYPDANIIPVDAAPDCEDVYPSLSAYTGKADLVVDFSHHSSTASVTGYAVSTGTPTVIATTGQTEQELTLIRSASANAPVFFASNMSVGIAVLIRLAKQAAQAFPDADIEIVEQHHNRKLDVPSGTALTIATELQALRDGSVLNIGRHENGKRAKEEIGVHSLRLGNVVGIHEILISTPSQTLTLKHEAHNRALFAEGAVEAGRFLMRKGPGLYDMRDFLEDNKG